MIDLDLNLLRVFDAVMRHRSVTSAAKDLGLTQSSVSNALNRLRDAVGDRLLVRQGNTMIPTRAAEELWPHVSEALANLARGLGTLQGFEPAAAKGRVRVAMGDYAMAVLAADLASLIARDAPDLVLELVAAVPDLALEQISAGQADLLIGAVGGDVGRLQTRPLFAEQFIGLCARSHDFAKSAATPEDFAQARHVLISARGRTSGNVDAGLKQVGLSRHVAVTVPGPDEAARIVAKGGSIVSCGARLARRLAVTYDLHCFALPVDVPGFSVRALFRAENRTSPSLGWLLSKTQEVAQGK